MHVCLPDDYVLEWLQWAVVSGHVVVMHVRLPDDYKLTSISPKRTTASPAVSVSDAADTQHIDSPVSEAAPLSVTDDAEMPISQAECEVPAWEIHEKTHISYWEFRAVESTWKQTRSLKVRENYLNFNL